MPVADTVVKFVQMGARMDGAVSHDPHGKTAVFRSPFGLTLSVFEPADDFDVGAHLGATTG